MGPVRVPKYSAAHKNWELKCAQRDASGNSSQKIKRVSTEGSSGVSGCMEKIRLGRPPDFISLKELNTAMLCTQDIKKWQTTGATYNHSLSLLLLEINNFPPLEVRPSLPCVKSGSLILYAEC